LRRNLINIIIFLVIIVVLILPVSFLIVIAIASVRQLPDLGWNNHAPKNRFMIAIQLTMRPV